MSHQPFETWILDNGPLTNEERRLLRSHIATCKQCQKLEHKWLSVHQELRARRMVAPAEGFATRWQTGLAGRRAREQRRNAWKVFGILAGSAMFILLIIASYLLSTNTPADWLVATIRLLSSSQDLLNLAYFAVLTWISNTPLALNIALWIYLTISLCVLSAVWGLIFWRSKSVGVLNQ